MPQIVKVQRKLTLIEAIVSSGGFGEDAARVVCVLRYADVPGSYTSEEFTVRDISTGRKEVELKGGEIIFVPKERRPFPLPRRPLIPPGEPMPKRNTSNGRDAAAAK